MENVLDILRKNDVSTKIKQLELNDLVENVFMNKKYAISKDYIKNLSKVELEEFLIMFIKNYPIKPIQLYCTKNKDNTLSYKIYEGAEKIISLYLYINDCYLKDNTSLLDIDYDLSSEEILNQEILETLDLEDLRFSKLSESAKKIILGKTLLVQINSLENDEYIDLIVEHIK